MDVRTLASALLALVVTACSGVTPPVPDAPATQTTALATAATAAPPASATDTAVTIWQPKPGLSWQIQYSGKLVAGKAKVVDVDGHETSAGTVAKLKKAGKRVICYFNAGGWEDFRPDKAAFPKAVTATSWTAGPASAGSTSGPLTSCCRS